MSKNCPMKKNRDKHKCANCQKLETTGPVSSNFAHPSNSVECPILQLEVKALLNRTMGCRRDEKVSKNEIAT